MQSIKYLTFILLLLRGTLSNAACVLDATKDTQAEVLACLALCVCSEVVIPDGVTINMTGNWNLSAAGNITFRIQGSGSLAFSGTELLTLASGSQLIIENTSNTNALTQSGTATDPRIVIGSCTAKGTDFSNVIANGGMTSACAFPVEMSAFYGTLIDKNEVSINWSTASEYNSDYFEVLFSADGRSFESVGKIKAAGFSMESQHYQFEHRYDFAAKEAFYRLKITNLDNTTDYTSIFKVNLNHENALSISPNPSSTSLYIHGLDYRQEQLIAIYNQWGSKVLEKALALDEPLQIKDLPVGLYVVRVAGLKDAITFCKQ